MKYRAALVYSWAKMQLKSHSVNKKAKKELENWTHWM